MKKIIIFIITVAVGFSACEEGSQELIYNSDKDNVYFNFDDDNTANRDSIFYTFAYTPEKAVDTILLPVIVSGKRVGSERSFRVEVVEKGTTAERDVHYTLPDSYPVPADSGEVYLPFIMHSSDPLLQDTSVAVNLKLIPSNDFSVDFDELIEARIIFSNRLEKPEWWDLWSPQLSTYSRTKHSIYLIVVGNEDLITDYGGDNYLHIPRNLFYIDQLRQFLNDPFTWTEGHSEEYALDKQSNQLYHFYSLSNPETIYKLKLNPDDGRFYFEDEFGQRVTVN